MVHPGKAVFCDPVHLMLTAVEACFALQLCRMHECDCMTRLEAHVTPVVMTAADSTARPPLG